MIKNNAKCFSVRMMCNLLCVSSSGYYYDWQDRPLSRRAQENAIFSTKIKAIFTDEYSHVGAKRITKRLKLEGTLVGRHRVAKIMRLNGRLVVYLLFCANSDKY